MCEYNGLKYEGAYSAHDIEYYTGICFTLAVKVTAKF